MAMSDSLTLNYTLDPEDCLAPKIAIRRWVVMFVVASIVSLAGVVGGFFLLNDGDMNWPVIGIAFAAAVVFVGVMYVIWVAVQLRIAPKKLQRRFVDYPFLATKQQAVVSSEGIRITTTESDVLLNWGIIERARMTDKVLLLLNGKEVLAAIPVRAFENSATARKFLALLREHQVELRR